MERAEAAYAEGKKSDAAAMFRVLAEEGSEGAQLRLAKLYETGEGVLANVLEAARWYRSAAEQGSWVAQSRLGEMYLTGMAVPDTATPAAPQRLEEGPDQQSLLKRLYPKGLALPQDPEQAARWNPLAAEAGDATAQARLGHQYATAFGVAKDLEAAERWFSAAAQQTNSAGQLGLGLVYAGAYGERRDHARALEFLEPCAAGGNSTAQLCLAILLLFGDVPHEDERGAALLEQAGAAGQPAAMFHLGELYAREGHPDKAMREFQEVLRIKPYWGPAHLGLGKALEATGRIQEAKEHFEQALLNRVNTPGSFNILAKFAFSRGWYGAAATNFADALRLNPADPETQVNFGLTLVKLGKHEEAKAHYLEAVRLQPNFAEAHFCLGVELGEEGDAPGAAAHFAEAVRLKPGLIEARLNLGIALSSQNRNQEALDQFEEVLRRDPKNQVALDRIKTLHSQMGR